jgi:hypothetical protein
LPRFFSLRDALVRLEVSLQLHNRLTAADCGVGAWPAPATDARDGFRWRLAKIFVPVVTSVMLVWAASSVPFVSKMAICESIATTSWVLMSGVNEITIWSF